MPGSDHVETPISERADRSMTNYDSGDADIQFDDYGFEKNSITSQQVQSVTSNPQYVSPSDTMMSNSTGPTSEENIQHFQSGLTIHADLNSISPGGLESLHGGCSISAETPNSQTTELYAGNTPGASSSVHIRDAAADLLALRFQPGETPMDQDRSMSEDFNTSSGKKLRGKESSILPSFRDSDFGALNEDIFDLDDGLFVPGSAYEELHTTLRNHIIHTARSNVPSRIPSPNFPHHVDGLNTSQTKNTNQELLEPELDSSNSIPNISPHQEYLLWKNYVDEVAPWVSATFL